MKKLLFYLMLSSCGYTASAQTSKTELYDLLAKLMYDSNGYENVGDWAVGKPKKFPVKWKADRIEMSDDTSINFFRMGTADISMNGRSFQQAGLPVKWNIMLKGPRMGYVSHSIISSPSKDFKPRLTIDSLFGKESLRPGLLKVVTKKTLLAIITTK